MQTLVPSVIGPWEQPAAESYVKHAVATLGVSSYCAGHWVLGLMVSETARGHTLCSSSPVASELGV